MTILRNDDPPDEPGTPKCPKCGGYETDSPDASLSFACADCGEEFEVEPEPQDGPDKELPDDLPEYLKRGETEADR